MNLNLHLSPSDRRGLGGADCLNAARSGRRPRVQTGQHAYSNLSEISPHSARRPMPTDQTLSTHILVAFRGVAGAMPRPRPSNIPDVRACKRCEGCKDGPSSQTVSTCTCLLHPDRTARARAIKCVLRGTHSIQAAVGPCFRARDESRRIMYCMHCAYCSWRHVDRSTSRPGLFCARRHRPQDRLNSVGQLYIFRSH